MFCLPGGALCAPASMRTAAVHPARSGERVTKSQTGIGLSRPGLAALNNRRCCPSDSWLQRGNICLKTCTPFTAGFMPESAELCVNKLAAGAPMAKMLRHSQKKYTNFYMMRIFGVCCSEQYSLPATAILCRASSGRTGGGIALFF